MSKIFVVSLPRTGTTSVCIHLLNQGYKVAHTAYTDEAFEGADVVADTPVFVDYSYLLNRYPKSKFVYLERPIELWLTSIRRLLLSMRKQWARNYEVFEFDIRRCFQAVFPEFEKQTEYSDEYLLACYRRHQTDLLEHVSSANVPFLRLDITKDNAEKILNDFCPVKNDMPIQSLPHVNRGRRISYWDDVVHENKVESKVAGRT